MPGGGAKSMFFMYVMLLNDKDCERHFAMKALELVHEPDFQF